MKKILVILICISIILFTIPIIGLGEVITSPVHMDFDDYTKGTSYGLCNFSTDYATDVGADQRGQSIKISSNAAARGIIFNSKLTKDAVFGFSFMTNDRTAYDPAATDADPTNIALVNAEKNTRIGALVTLEDGPKVKARANDGERVYSGQQGEWIDVSVGMDYTNQKAYIWAKGREQTEWNYQTFDMSALDYEVTGTDYFNINIEKNKYTNAANAAANKDYISLYFDDMFVYNAPTAVEADIPQNNVESDTVEEINITFNQNVLWDDDAEVTLNGIPADCEPVMEHGYVTGVKVKNVQLDPAADYEIAFSGIKDFFDKPIMQTFQFTTASNEPVIKLIGKSSDGNYVQGTKVSFGIEAANMKGNTIDVYHNGELVDTVSSDTKEISFVLKGGTNTVYLEAPAFNIKSNELTLHATAYDIISNVKMIDFNDGTTTALETVYKAKGLIEVRPTDEEHGQSLYMEYDPGDEAINGGNLPYIDAETITNKQGVYVYEAEFKFSDISKSDMFFAIRNDADKWNIPVKLLNGNLCNNKNEVLYSNLETDTWYKCKAVYDLINKQTGFCIDDVMVAEGIPMTNNEFKSMKYVRHNVTGIAKTKTWMYVDNIKTYFMAEKFNVTADDNVPYENAAVNLTFSQEMNPETLKNAIMTDSVGMKTQVEFTTEDNKTFTAKFDSLKANTQYTFDLSNALTALGASGNDTEVSFKTEKLPFALKAAETKLIGSDVKITAKIKNDNNEDKSYVVFAVLSDGSLMYGADAKAMQSSNNETIELLIPKPDGDYSAEVYVFDSIDSLNLIDKLIVE